MLLESAIASEAGASFVVLGVGINVNQVEFPDLIQSLATSMMLATGQFFDRGFVLAELVNRLEKNLLLLEEAPEDIVSAYQDLLAGVGNPLSVSDVHTGSSFEGTMLGIDDAGALLLDMGSHVQSFHAGDVKLLSSELSSE